jgi:hypothetical protein
MRDVRRRAERAGARRVLGWLGGIGVAIGLGVPVGGALLSPADNDAVVGVGVSDASTTTSAPVDGAVPIPGPLGATTTSTLRLGSGSGVDGARLAEDALTASGLGGDTAQTATTTLGASASRGSQPSPKIEATEGYPLASSCSVDNAGLGPRRQRTCQFTATTRGGAEMRSNGVATAAGNGAEGQVTVTRDGKRTTTNVQFNSASAGDLGVFRCGGLIEPGDLVEVVLTNGAGSPDGSTMTLGAGEGWYCWEG